jgi:hypothetical protein
VFSASIVESIVQTLSGGVDTSTPSAVNARRLINVLKYVVHTDARAAEHVLQLCTRRLLPAQAPHSRLRRDILDALTCTACNCANVRAATVSLSTFRMQTNKAQMKLLHLHLRDVPPVMQQCALRNIRRLTMHTAFGWTRKMFVDVFGFATGTKSPLVVKLGAYAALTTLVSVHPATVDLLFANDAGSVCSDDENWSLNMFMPSVYADADVGGDVTVAVLRLLIAVDASESAARNRLHVHA